MGNPVLKNDVSYNPTKHGHALSVPLELDFMGEIKRRVFGCEVCSRGLALPFKDVGRGYIFMIKGSVEKVGVSINEFK